MATLNIKSFPEDLYERLRHRAEDEHRSVAQQVVHFLEEILNRPEPLSILELRGLGRELWRKVDSSTYVAEERDSWDS